MLQSFNKAYKAQPLIANLLSSCTIGFVGDLACQRYEYQLKRGGGLFSQYYDYRRSVIMGSIGLVFVPFALKMYKFTDSLYPTKSIPNAFKQGFTNFVIIVACNPIVLAGVHVSSSMWIHNVRYHTMGEMATSVYDRVSNIYGVHTLASLCYWCVHWVPMLYYTPHHLRILYGAMASVGWSVINSYVQNSFGRDKQNDEPEPSVD
eukprot:PhF_6_TR8496/c0_g1_i1/m.13292/K13348/MPV17; protein Mpv17